jgi:ketosteroid isomerase-like protein
MDAGSIVEGIYAAWKARDLPKTLTFLADDMVYDLHIPPELMPGAGETKGKDAVAALFQGLLDTYDFLSYEPGPVEADGPIAKAEVHFRYRQKVTGDVIESRMRHVWFTDNGQVKRLDEWHDLLAVRDFLARVDQKLS